MLSTYILEISAKNLVRCFSQVAVAEDKKVQLPQEITDKLNKYPVSFTTKCRVANLPGNLENLEFDNLGKNNLEKHGI